MVIEFLILIRLALSSMTQSILFSFANSNTKAEKCRLLLTEMNAKIGYFVKTLIHAN